MATALENARTRYNAIWAELAALTSSAAGGKPNASGGDNTIDHVGYKDGLYRELEALEKRFPVLKTEVDGAGNAPFEVRTRATT